MEPAVPKALAALALVGSVAVLGVATFLLVTQPFAQGGQCDGTAALVTRIFSLAVIAPSLLTAVASGTAVVALHKMGRRPAAP